MAASSLLVLVVAGCNYDWEPRDLGDAASEVDSSTQPVMADDASLAGDASLAPDGAAAAGDGDTLDAAPGDAAQGAASGDASGSVPASDASSEMPGDTELQDAMTPDANACPSGQHMCGDRCVMNDSLQSCGQSCSPCVLPANGVSSSCDGTQCGFTCTSAYHACGATCASNSDVASCGTRCSPCPVPANGRAVCTNGTCGIACDPNYLNCGATCAGKSFGFEDGTLSGAAKEEHNSRGATTEILSSTTRKHTGSRALSVGFSATSAEARNLTVRLPICAGAGADLSNSYVSMWVYVDGPSTLSGFLTTALASRNATGVGDPDYELLITPNTWQHLRSPVKKTWALVKEVGLYMYAYPQGSDSWSGTVYIDDVTID